MNLTITNRIYTIRGKQVMLDRDLAQLYEIPTKALNQAVKRNNERFPEEFMFQMTQLELKKWKSQIVTTNRETMGLRRLPYVFTEQGVAMLSAILKSRIAIKVSLQIMKSFVQMRRFLQSNANIFSRLNSVERKQIKYDKNFEKIFKAIESKEVLPKQGIFFDGQVFDSHKFVCDLISKAQKKIILIDNFVDENTLSLFCDVGFKVLVYTKNFNEKLNVSLKKYNKQYGNVEVLEFDKSHDRFLVIDDELYHFGASLKDLGKKWFAFSKFNSKEILNFDF